MSTVTYGSCEGVFLVRPTHGIYGVAACNGSANPCRPSFNGCQAHPFVPATAPLHTLDRAGYICHTPPKRAAPLFPLPQNFCNPVLCTDIDVKVGDREAQEPDDEDPQEPHEAARPHADARRGQTSGGGGESLLPENVPAAVPRVRSPSRRSR